ncbi:MAG: response regulator transcription factor [Treponema sp.]|nr:response regulator transcription factor [Treponema sp.]
MYDNIFAKNIEIAVEGCATFLSKQERNIFEALLQEKSNKQICDKLFISPRTVENYTSRLYSKIGVKKKERSLLKNSNKPL